MAQGLCKQESHICILSVAIVFTSLVADFTWAQVWRDAGVSLLLPCKAPWHSYSACQSGCQTCLGFSKVPPLP